MEGSVKDNMKKKLSALLWALAYGLVGLAYLSDERMFYAILSWIFLACSIGYFINLFYQIFQEPLDKWWGQIPEDEYWFPVIIATLKFHLIDRWLGKLKKYDKFDYKLYKKEKLRLKKKKKK